MDEETNDMDNINNSFCTPKKRQRPSSVQALRTPFLNPRKSRDDHFSVPYANKKIRKYSSDNLVCTSTPVSKIEPFLNDSKHVFNNEFGKEVPMQINLAEAGQILKDYERDKIKVLENLKDAISFHNSIISLTNLDPEVIAQSERCIFSYPVFFETSSFAKFTHRMLISKTKLSKIDACQHRFNGKHYVVKSGHQSITGSHCLSETSKELINELKILTLIGKHVHIVDYFDSWIEDECFHIQLELVRGGSLLDFIVGNIEVTEAYSDIYKIDKNFQISNGSAIVLLAQISSVLVYLHDILHIFHGDIKPSNILVELLRYSSTDFSEMREECHKVLLEIESNPILRFKLCDFGRSGITSKVNDMDEGDGRYLPAFDDNFGDTHLFATSRDIYSFGLTIYDCLGGIITFETSSAIRDGNWGPWPENITEEWRNIIQRMSHILEVYRFAAREIIEMEIVKDFVLPEALVLIKLDTVTTAMETNNCID